MKKDIILKLAMLERVDRFILDHPITPALPAATAAHAEVTSIITSLQAAAQNQTAGFGKQADGVDLRENLSRTLRASLKQVNRTARVIDAESPGIRSTFRLPASGSYPALIASAQAIIATATELQTEFTEAGMPAAFFTELTAFVTEFQEATSKKHTGRANHMIGTAALKVQASLGVLAAQKLDAYMRNSFRANPEILAGWAGARRIEKASRQNPEPPLPPVDPGSGSGGGTPNTAMLG